MSVQSEELYIKRDRMRYSKNKLSANLAILAIVFDVFYFVSIYRSDVGSYYYTILTGASVVYNLLFMLAAFLSSEGAKNYVKSYSYVLGAIGIGQIIRIFIIPMKAHTAIIKIGGVEMAPMGNTQFVMVTIYLVLSAVCLLAAAVTNYQKCTILENHLKSIENSNS